MGWTDQFGTASYDTRWGVAVDSSGNVDVAGMTTGILDGATRSNTT